jgi:hypothetical protein
MRALHLSDKPAAHQFARILRPGEVLNEGTIRTGDPVTLG